MAVVTFQFGGMNNMNDPADVGKLDTSQRKLVFTEAVDLVNLDPDNDGGVARRSGQLQLDPTRTHSGWSFDGVTAYFVQGGMLCRFDGTAATPLKAVDPDAPMAFCQVNDVVWFSNGIVIGIISEGGVVAPQTEFKPSKLPTPAGQCLEFYNGRGYVASGVVLYCTDGMSIEQTDQRGRVVAEFDVPICMVRRVDDGLFIGTENEIVFLPGKDMQEGGFDFISVAPYGAIPGTGARVKSEKVPAAKLPAGNAVVFASQQGICAGGAGGAFTNLSLNTVNYAHAVSGGALVREEHGLVHFLFSAMGGTTS